MDEDSSQVDRARRPMMALVFLFWTVAFVSAIRSKTRLAPLLGLAALLLTAIAFRIHLTDVIRLDL